MFLALGAAMVVGFSQTPNPSGRGYQVIKAITVTDSVQTQAVYTCPMHPEVEMNEPGQCPKCGMDLVLKDGTNTNTCTAMEKCKEQGGKCMGESGSCNMGDCGKMKMDNKDGEKKEHDHNSDDDGDHEGHQHSGCKHKGC